MSLYSYNYPWSGRLGRISRCCVYCGDSGPRFQISSRANCCTRCSSKDAPIPEFVARDESRYHELALAWCDERGIDYEATVASYEKNLGPKMQERDSPIPGADQDFTVFKVSESVTR